MLDGGVVVLTAFISPFRSERDMARSLFEPDEFLEIFVDVPIEIAEQRDPKGLYKKARRGELPNFTGIDSRYEVRSHRRSGSKQRAGISKSVLLQYLKLRLPAQPPPRISA